jgi:hypothetical protein
MSGGTANYDSSDYIDGDDEEDDTEVFNWACDQCDCIAFLTTDSDAANECQFSKHNELRSG